MDKLALKLMQKFNVEGWAVKSKLHSIHGGMGMDKLALNAEI